jgi:hypothetical protein
VLVFDTVKRDTYVLFMLSNVSHEHRDRHVEYRGARCFIRRQRGVALHDDCIGPGRRLTNCGDRPQQIACCLPAEAAGSFAQTNPASMQPLGTPQMLIPETRERFETATLRDACAAKVMMSGDAIDVVTIDGAGHFEVIAPTATARATDARTRRDSSRRQAGCFAQRTSIASGAPVRRGVMRSQASSGKTFFIVRFPVTVDRTRAGATGLTLSMRADRAETGGCQSIHG